MKSLPFMALLILIACGADVGSNKNRPQPEQNTPAVTPTPTPPSPVIVSSVSYIHRKLGVKILTYAEEITLTLTSNLPTYYHKIPVMGLDSEGVDGKNVYTRTGLGRPKVACGTDPALTTIKSRIEDCSTKNTDKAVWNGTSFGSSGESSWKLVTLNLADEMWLDERTGLIWSNIVATKSNWCAASGNIESAVPPETTVDCETLGAAKNICADDAENFKNTIQWRLPTRNDFLQADLNGLRFVLDTTSTVGLWTSTMKGSTDAMNMAWTYTLPQGTLVAEPLETERNVRCVGLANYL